MPGRSTRSLALMAKCPHCSNSMPMGALVVRAGMLGGSHYRLKCPTCHRDSYLARDMRNVLGPIAILTIGVVASLPPVSDAYHLSPVWLAITRAGIWSASTLLALGLFAFGGRLTALDTEPIFSMKTFARVRVVNLAFQLSMLYWMYVVFRGLLEGP